MTFYTLQEFIIYNDIENLQSFDTFNYDNFLNFMIQQKSKFKFYFKEKNDVIIDDKKNLKVKEYTDALDYKNKNKINLKKFKKRKSAGAAFFVREKKKKNSYKKRSYIIF